MRVLTLNCGSSSIKFQFIDTKTEEVMASGIAERIGEDLSLFTYKSEKYTKKKREMIIPDHEKGIELIIGTLMDPIHGIVSNPDEIDAVGHRLVHGGEHFSDSVLINPEVLRVLKKCIPLAPLHNPANIKGVEGVTKSLPNVIQAGTFDTAFHQTMPPQAYLYAIPYEFYSRHKIRRYGFHGTSHKFVSNKAAEYTGRDFESLKIITCHVGNGASITAVDKGKSVDTSMGFTPLEGLVMGTRCGDIDPAIPFHLMKEFDLTPDEVYSLLNKRSGMLGLSQISNDMREIEEEILDRKNEAAIQAHDVYAYRIKKYIGAYIAAMNGLDILVFTGGVGERMPILRELVCASMDYLGIRLNLEENARFTDTIQDLSHPDATVKVLKIPTNEELMIALDAERLVREQRGDSVD